MRQILRLLRGGNKHNLFLILSSPSHWTNLPGQKEGDSRMKYFGMGTIFSYSSKNTHDSARPPPLAGRRPWVGTTWALCSLVVPANSRWDPALPAAGKPSSLKATSGPIASFPRVSQPDVCLLMVCKWRQEDWQRGFRNYLCTFAGTLMSKENGERQKQRQMCQV